MAGPLKCLGETISDGGKSLKKSEYQSKNLNSKATEVVFKVSS